MKKIQNAVSFYRELFRSFKEQENGHFQNAYSAVREQAIQQLAETGFPTKKTEDWRFTDLQELLEQNFTLAQPFDLNQEQKKKIESLLPDVPNSIKLVFVNGYFNKEFSQTQHLPKGLHLEVKENDLSSIHTQTESNKNGFHLLAEAFSRQGVLVRVDQGQSIEQPVYILSVSAGGSEPLFFAQRNRIVLGPLGALSLVEQHLSLDGQPGFQAFQTLLELDDSARLDYYQFQNESKTFYHLNQVDATVGEHATFRSHSIDFGGKLVRNTIRVTLDGTGSDATLNGLYLANGTQHMDNHTTIVHAQAHGSSNELFQGILDDQANGVFSGKILVQPDAQKTDAKQSNNCLLLSEQAKIDSKPQLEIYADDVKCTHGATVGQLDEEEIFYLRSRGISEVAARSILTYAFAERVIEQIKIPLFKDQVEAAFNAKFKDYLTAEQ